MRRKRLLITGSIVGVICGAVILGYGIKARHKSKSEVSTMGDQYASLNTVKPSAFPNPGRAPASEAGAKVAALAPQAPRAADLPLVGSEGGLAKQVCSSAEFRGQGVGDSPLSPHVWGQIKPLYDRAKKDLLAWLKSQASGMDPGTHSKLSSLLEGVKIYRPGTGESSELAWRGIGVFTYDAKNRATIRLGGGFVPLALHHPKRAKFELTRLLAQAWAPCELKRAGVEGNPFGPTLSCLDVSDANACAEGSLSESGWAVSSALAFQLNPPGCKISGFDDAKGSSCFPIKVQAPVRSVASVVTPATKDKSEEKGATK